MTHKSSIIAVVLVSLTLASFALVSSYISKRPNHVAIPAAAPAPRTPIFTATATPAASNRPVSSDKQIYQNLGQAQTLLDQLRNAVLASSWEEAQWHFYEFTQKTQQLPAPQLNQPDISPVLQDFFTLYRVELGQALNEQHAVNARFALNQLQAIVSDQRARLGTRGLPLEFNRLAFLAREVELWAQLNNQELLQERVKALRETWAELRPLIVARRNGRESATQFDQLIEQFSTSTPPDLTALSAACLKELEQMEALFRHNQTKSTNPAISPGKPADE